MDGCRNSTTKWRQFMKTRSDSPGFCPKTRTTPPYKNPFGRVTIYSSQRKRLTGTLKNTAYGSHIRRRITSADGPLTKGNSDAAGARRPPASDKPPMSMNGLLRCQAKLTQPKAGVAACLAMIPSVYNGTSCPATATSNGGSSERSSEG